MKHLDLFSGIGGFAYAVDQVWENAEHIFCDNDKFCQQVLKKHWPDSPIFSDIRGLTADTFFNEHRAERTEIREAEEIPGIGGEALDTGRVGGTDSARTTITNPVGSDGGGESNIELQYKRWQASLLRTTSIQSKNREARSNNSQSGIDLVTGGFPCQPFSAAGRRKGTADDRYLWPEMFRVIRLTKPAWVIAENVYGLVTWDNGLVLEQVCSDLESEGYEVQPFIIPAVAVNAPHRRDRVWIVGNLPSKRYSENGEVCEGAGSDTIGGDGTNTHAENERPRGRRNNRCEIRERELLPGEQENGSAVRDQAQGRSKYATDTDSFNGKRIQSNRDKSERSQGKDRNKSWSQNWIEVATEFCGMDDGIPAELDYAGWTKAGHRVQRLKAMGNAIVPQVAIEIMRSIKDSYKELDETDKR